MKPSGRSHGTDKVMMKFNDEYRRRMNESWISFGTFRKEPWYRQGDDEVQR